MLHTLTNLSDARNKDNTQLISAGQELVKQSYFNHLTPVAPWASYNLRHVRLHDTTIHHNLLPLGQQQTFILSFHGGFL